MRLPLFRRLVILASSLFVLGCSDSLAPGDVAGMYMLARIGSESLPAVLYENEQFGAWVISETIRLRSDGTGTISGLQDLIPWQDEHSATGPVWSERPVRFRIADGRIEIEFICPPNALCVAPPHLVARRTRDGLRATYFQSPVPLYYTEVVAPR